MKRWIAGALVMAAVALGTAACSNDDNGGVIKGPTTTVGAKTSATRSSDYSG